MGRALYSRVESYYFLGPLKEWNLFRNLFLLWVNETDAYVFGANMVSPPSVMMNLESTGYSASRPSKISLAADTSNARWCASEPTHLPSDMAC